MRTELGMLLRAVVLGFMVLGFSNSTVAMPTISLDPADAIKYSGDTFAVNVIGDSLSDIYAFQFSLMFDQTILQASDITEGTFLSSAGTTFFIPGTIDNLGGIISFTGDTLIGAIPGASGSGVLASINFKASAAGLSGLSFQDILFLDSNLNEIAISNLDGSVSVVNSDGNVSEPSFPLLLLAGCVVLAFMQRTRWSLKEKSIINDQWS